MNHITMKTAQGYLITAPRPTNEDIDNLKVGDIAPFVFGESEVTKIHYVGNDIKGRRFACYYVKYGSHNGEMSASLKSGEVVRTMSVCNAFKSHEIQKYDI